MVCLVVVSCGPGIIVHVLLTLLPGYSTCMSLSFPVESLNRLAKGPTVEGQPAVHVGQCM